ncbi:MAG: septum formation protein Maf [Bacteroidetes bacterium]|nr:septum formation protein Maf [Bacteroidota bacterium]
MHMIPRLNEISLILGSKSPRRKALLAQMDVEFETFTIDADESFGSDIPVSEVAVFLANKKSSAFSGRLHKKLLITSDTTVLCGNEILNKPADAKEAQVMLSKLSGNSHIVNTGVCLRTEEKSASFYVETEVTFKPLTDEEIEYYINTYKPFDKAGGYGIQEWIGMIGISSINGCYYNVMGLPIHKLYTELCTFLSE